MSNFNINRITKILRKKTDLSILDASYVAGLVINSISEALMNGEKVVLRKLGTFSLKKVKSKTVKSSFMTYSVHVPEHEIISFKPSPKLKNAIRLKEKAGKKKKNQ